MKITLKDGSFKEYESAMAVIDIAKDISEGLARVACVAEVDGKIVDLRTTVDKDCTLNILTFDSEEGKKAYRHTCAHVMAEAVKHLYPDAKLTIGPAIDNGYYYDFDMESLDRAALDAIEKEMKKIIKKGDKLERFELSKEEAIELMTKRDEPYKVEMIKEHPDTDTLTFYQQGDFIEFCAGPHLMSTKTIKAFKLTSSSGAYWRGDEKNKMLTRIYGTAFTKTVEVTKNTSFTIDVADALTASVFIAGDNNTANKGVIKATFTDESGTVTDITPTNASLGGRKTATTAFELVATGKGTITVTPNYNSLLYKVAVK